MLLMLTGISIYIYFYSFSQDNCDGVVPPKIREQNVCTWSKGYGIPSKVMVFFFNL